MRRLDLVAGTRCAVILMRNDFRPWAETTTVREPLRRRGRWTTAVPLVAAGAVAMLVFSACTSSAPLDAGTAGSGSGSGRAGLEGFYEQELTWGACDDFATTPPQVEIVTSGVGECARLEVPLITTTPPVQPHPSPSLAWRRAVRRSDPYCTTQVGPAAPD